MQEQISLREIAKQLIKLQSDVNFIKNNIADAKIIPSEEIQSEFNSQSEEDLEFARRTEEAYQRIENGEYISVDSENLEEEMRKW